MPSVLVILFYFICFLLKKTLHCDIYFPGLVSCEVFYGKWVLVKDLHPVGRRSLFGPLESFSLSSYFA